MHDPARSTSCETAPGAGSGGAEGAPSFCPWYPLAAAREHAPDAPGVLQVRVAHGLVAYPRGKSAMIHYALAGSVREAASALAAAHPGAAWLCRHVAGEPAAMSAVHADVLRRFLTRFGAPPTLPGSDDEAGRAR